MKLAIAGGLGFIGSSVAALAMKSGYKTTILTRSSIGSTILKHPRLEIFGANNLTETEKWRRALRESDAVICAIGNGGPSKAHLDAPNEIIENLPPSARVIQECARAGVRKIILISSAGTVYGETKDTPAREDWPLNPAGLYGATKASLEMYTKAICTHAKVRHLIIRLTNPYGPWQIPGQGQGLIANAINSAQTNVRFQIWGSGHETRDYIFISDVAEAIVRLCKSNTEGVVNLSAGQSVSTIQILETLEHKLSRRIEREETKAAFSLPKNIAVSNSRICQELQWIPAISLEQGIETTLRWHRDVYSKLDHAPKALAEERAREIILGATVQDQARKLYHK